LSQRVRVDGTDLRRDHARHYLWVGFIMSVALNMVIDGLVTLRDRQALEDMRQHRQRLRMQLLLKRGSAFDPGKSIKMFETEMAMIETGLARLGEAAV
jgi:hypothetical protein